MKIAVTGGKGGTGKSTIATSLAMVFSEMGKKTMLVDADVDCPDDHLMLSIKRKKSEDVYQPVPSFDAKKCTMCGKCAEVCKQNCIVFVKGKPPAFIPDMCIGCKACIAVCPSGVVRESRKKIGEIFTGSNYGIKLVSGQLGIGQLASGEMVSETRKFSESVEKKQGIDVTIIDSAAGIGCTSASTSVKPETVAGRAAFLFPMFALASCTSGRRGTGVAVKVGTPCAVAWSMARPSPTK